MHASRNGFTLVELVVIITIIGVLAVVASARFSGPAPFDARGYYDELSSAARFAQRYAVSSGCVVRLNIASGSYSLTLQNSGPGCATTTLQRPGGGAFTGTAPSGVTASGALGDHDFNALGDLSSGGGTITVSGGGSLSFTITAGSGFVVTP